MYTREGHLNWALALLPRSERDVNLHFLGNARPSISISGGLNLSEVQHLWQGANEPLTPHIYLFLSKMYTMRNKMAFGNVFLYRYF